MPSPRRYHGKKQWAYLYKTVAWKRLREQALAQCMGVCSWCGVRLVLGSRSSNSAVVHHMVAHKGDLVVFHEPTNLEVVCKACHDRPIQVAERTGISHIDEDGWPVKHTPHDKVEGLAGYDASHGEASAMEAYVKDEHRG